nr:insulin-related peptide - great pond snail (fragments) [Lymnaea stagnalis]
TTQHTCSKLSRFHPRGLCGSTLANMVQWLCSTTTTSSQSRPSIVCECCFNQCTVQELLRYC